jgi:hypothetical protein
MAGDEGDGVVGIAIRRRDAGIGEAADPRGDAGDDAEGNAGGGERQRLLAAAAEDEGIAALEAQHPFALSRQPNEPLGDVGLLLRGFSAALSGVFERGAGRGKAEDTLVHQGVVDDRVRPPQRMEGEEREQPRIARPRADQPHRTRREGRQIEVEVHWGRP